MAKKWISLFLTLALFCGLCACQKEPPASANHEEAAERFLEAYYTRDRLTQFSLFFYDARTKWEDQVIKDNGSAEAFFEVAQKQADEKGIDVTVDSFDSYYIAYHQFILADCRNIYGDYTLTTKATESIKLEGEELDQFRDKQLGAIDAKYIDKDAFNAVTEAYAVTVNIQIHGEKREYTENYRVYMVHHDGQWLVIDHST